MTEQNENTYTCAQCGRVFAKAWTDEEAQQEYAELYTPEVAAQDPGVCVCDNCYNEIMARVRTMN